MLRRPHIQIRSESVVRCNPAIQASQFDLRASGSPWPPQKKNAAQFHLAAGSNPLSWFTSLPSQPPRARTHKSTTHATTASAAHPLAEVPHAQKPTPVPSRLQHFANFCLEDFRRMTDSAFELQLFHHFQKPLHRAGRFDPYRNRTRQCGINFRTVSS